MDKNYGPVGQCIYCRSTVYNAGEPNRTLATEHVIPSGVGGDILLTEGSCRNCEKITSAFEGTALRVIFGPLRIHFNLPSRRKKSRPECLPIELRYSDGHKKIIDVPIDHHPLMVALPKLAPPKILGGDEGGDKVTIVNFPKGKEFADQQLQKIAFSHNAERAVVAHKLEYDSLVLLLAKIAHAYTVALFGIEAFESFLPLGILSKDAKGLRDYVGGTDAKIEQDTVHHIEWGKGDRGGETLIIWRISLFGSLGLPTYEIVSGRMT